jgi:hypothetical protein
MKSRQIYVLSLGAVTSWLLMSCSEDPATGPSIETLTAAIRAVGYPCTSVIDSNELSNGRPGWRVACQDTFTYTANISDDGSICITPVPYADSVGPTLVQTIDEQCVSAGDI